jgi:hypothetical protein
LFECTRSVWLRIFGAEAELKSPQPTDLTIVTAAVVVVYAGECATQ